MDVVGESLPMSPFSCVCVCVCVCFNPAFDTVQKDPVSEAVERLDEMVV